MLRSLVLTGLLVSVAMPVMAQDVVMRRPLPRNVTTTPTAPTPPPAVTPPVQPQDGQVGYGYYPACDSEARPECSQATAISFPWGVSTMTQSVDDSFCQMEQTPESINVARWSGMTPGGVGVDPFEMCEKDDLIFGYYQSCRYNQTPAFTYECYGFDESTRMSAPFPDASCRSSATPQSVLDQYGMASVEMVDNNVDQYGCGDDNDPGPLPEPEPEEPTEPEEPPTTPGMTYDHQWTAGPWDGAAVCGQPSTLSREIACVRYDVTEEGRINPVPAPSRTCEWAASNDKPETEYSGDQAGCSFRIEEISGPGGGGIGGGGIGDNGEYGWTLLDDAPPGDTPFCSSYAVYNPQLRCVSDQTDTEVSMSYCTENYSSGGVRNTVGDRKVGNFSGCTAEWKLVAGEGNYCSGDDLLMDIVDHACVRRGQRVDDVQCAPEDRPSAQTTMVIGRCDTRYFGLDTFGGMCMGGPAGTGRVIERSIPQPYADSWSGNLHFASPESVAAAEALCESAEASCCSIVKFETSQPATVWIWTGDTDYNPTITSPNGSQFYSYGKKRTRVVEEFEIDRSKFYDPNAAACMVNPLTCVFG